MSDEARPFRFDDGKDADALRTIGEVSAGFGIRQHVLRYWEQQFPMLRPLKRSGGRRHYRPGDVALVETIDRLINREGYTLKGARQAIEKGRAQTGSTRAGPDEAPLFTSSAAPDEESGLSAPGNAPQPASSGRAEVDVLPQLRAIRERLAAALSA